MKDSYDDIKKNPNGSVNLYFGQADPAGKELNWVKISTGTELFLYLRWYGRLKEDCYKSWELPVVVKSK